MNAEGLSDVINLQTAGVVYEFQGVITYDRRVFKPELASEDAAQRIGEANWAVIEASREIG